MFLFGLIIGGVLGSTITTLLLCFVFGAKEKKYTEGEE